jgi:tRNA nucleotidyltransferase (CCA-adding enzyme)
MKTYLVGGAVRDQLLGLPVQERDWVVVGASPEELLGQHYRQVGRSFPVFLHPQTGEEYALARTERKSASGYYGFTCDFNPKVTIEEDLLRRDLTINAMAMDEHGQLIDPYHGQDDLNNRILRHVSGAFVEDPVRVLRVARFAASFHHLGFRLADDTRALMYTMVRAGELAHLVPERIWQEWEKSLLSENPEQFIIQLRACDALRILLPEVEALFGVPNPVIYHPEIDSGVHTIEVLQRATQISCDPIVRFAALMHDLGKGATDPKAWPSHHGHDLAGIALIRTLCHRLRIPNEYQILAMAVAKSHLKIGRVFELRATTIVKTLEQLDAFRRPTMFAKLLTACEADSNNPKLTQIWQELLRVCTQVTAKELLQEGYSGPAIKEALHEKRVAVVNDLVQLLQRKKST